MEYYAAGIGILVVHAYRNLEQDVKPPSTVQRCPKPTALPGPNVGKWMRLPCDRAASAADSLAVSKKARARLLWCHALRQSPPRDCRYPPGHRQISPPQQAAACGP